MKTTLPIIGWREWITLTEFGLPPIKAKIDTGARTSALHTFFVDSFKKGGQQWVRFGLHPDQHSTEFTVECEALVKDRRWVTDSGGHRQRRFVIDTQMSLGQVLFTAEMTLTKRDNMKFRMLLGRTAINDRFVVDPSLSYRQGGHD